MYIYIYIVLYTSYVYKHITHTYLYMHIYFKLYIYIPLYSFLGYAIHVQFTKSSIPGVSSRLSKGMGSSEHDGWPQDPGLGNPWWHGVIAGASTINPWKFSRSRWTPEKIYLYLKRKIIWTWTSMIWVQKLLMFPGVLFSDFNLMKKCGYPAKGNGWERSCCRFFHVMKWMLFFSSAFLQQCWFCPGRQRWYLSVVKAETYLCWLAWSMVHGIHDWIFSFRMVNGMVESGKIPKKPQQDYISRRKDVVNHPSLNFFGLACASGCFFWVLPRTFSGL